MGIGPLAVKGQKLAQDPVLTCPRGDSRAAMQKAPAP